jgi:hypothetical protein
VRRAALILLALPAAASAGPAAQPPAAPEPPELATLAVSVRASSTWRDKAASHEPWYALGSDPTKFWCADRDTGEQLVIALAEPTEIDSFTLRAGVWRSPELFRAYNQLVELALTADDGRTKVVTLRDEREDAVVRLGRPALRELRLSVTSVQKGKIDRTCISGIDLHTSPARSIVIVPDASAAPPLDAAFANTWRALTACDDAGLRAQLKLPFTGVGRQLGDAKAARKACKDGAFRAFVAPGATLRVKPEAPGKAIVFAGALEWHFVLEGKTWRLATLVDPTR